MACDECGAKRGHMSGCSKDAAGKQTVGRRKGGQKGLGTNPKRICYACKGTGMVGKKVCPFCDGTGEKK